MKRLIQSGRVDQKAVFKAEQIASHASTAFDEGGLGVDDVLESLHRVTPQSMTRTAIAPSYRTTLEAKPWKCVRVSSVR